MRWGGKWTIYESSFGSKAMRKLRHMSRAEKLRPYINLSAWTGKKPMMPEGEREEG
jgi:hypothetical protein